jgi:predicted PurR-regulated permease PerM
MKRYRNIGQVVIFILVFSVFIYVVHQFIIPVIVGLLVSLVFRPIFLWLMNRLGNRQRLAAALSTFVIVFCVLFPLIMIGSHVVKDVANLARKVNEASSQANSESGKVMQIPLVTNIYDTINTVFPIPQDKFEQQARGTLARLSESGKNLVGSILGSVPRAVTSLIFFLIAFYFGLVDGPRLVTFIQENSPFSARETQQVFRITQSICNAVVLGAFLAGIVQGTITGLAYWILGIPKPVFFGALTALFGLIPLVGSAPMGVGGTIYLLTIGKPVKALIMLGFFGLAAISDNIVKPWVLKGKSSLHPFLGLLSVLGGLKAFGIEGIFLGPVITGNKIVGARPCACPLRRRPQGSSLH